MLVIALAVLVAIAQAQNAHDATKKADAARRKAMALLEAKSRADDAAENALVELDRVRVQTAEQLAACRASTTEQAQAATRAELEGVRAVAAKAVTDAQAAAETSVQQVIAEARAQFKAIQDQVDATKAEAEQLIETLRAELSDATKATSRAELDQTTVPQPAQAGLTPIRPRGLSGRHTTKMTPALVDKAQQMYDSGRYAVPEIAKSCAVSSTTIYRHIRTGRPRRA